MIKSIYVAPTQTDQLEQSGANHLMVAEHDLTKARWHNLKKLGMELSIAVGAFGTDGCPANPKALEKLLRKIDWALRFQPAQIWLDHFRFDGHWEKIAGTEIPDVHVPCRFCHSLNRAEVLAKNAQVVMDKVAGRCQIGYYAVPFKDDEVPQLIEGLGQDHSQIGQIFDLSSPMLYHRMIKKPISYISDYVRWIAQATGHPVLPIIQIKDMPDDLPDLMTEDDIQQAFDQAKQPPSIGVAIFWWVHAIEKGKTIVISKLFSAVE